MPAGLEAPCLSVCLGAGPHSGLCPLSLGNVPGAGGSKMSLQHSSHIPRTSPTRGAVRKVREGWQHEGGHVKPQHLNHRHPAPPKLITHHLGFTFATEKSCCGFSNKLSSSHESCWAFLWEMKSFLTADCLSLITWLKCYNGSISGASLNLLGRLQAKATPPAKQGSLLTLLHLLLISQHPFQNTDAGTFLL